MTFSCLRKGQQFRRADAKGPVYLKLAYEIKGGLLDGVNCVELQSGRLCITPKNCPVIESDADFVSGL